MLTLLQTSRLFKRRIIAAAISLGIMAGAVQAFETQAGAAFVIDQKTNTVLLSKNADVVHGVRGFA